MALVCFPGLCFVSHVTLLISLTLRMRAVFPEYSLPAISLCSSMLTPLIGIEETITLYVGTTTSVPSPMKVPYFSLL